jgi:hypothetical protein
LKIKIFSITLAFGNLELNTKMLGASDERDIDKDVNDKNAIKMKW